MRTGSPLHRLNETAYELVERLLAGPNALGIATSRTESGSVIVDCGVNTPGGDSAGLEMARIAMAGFGDVSLLPAGQRWKVPTVCVTSDHPVEACLASQYAGWKVHEGRYFAMASGPIRAAIGREELFARLAASAVGDCRERPVTAVGLLEASKLPADSICRALAESARVDPRQLVLLVARTSSAAGTLQVVARSLETALHKLDTLDFDLGRIVRGHASAPLPPLPNPPDDLEAIGRTNDSILYGGEVVLEVDADEASIADVGPRSVSGASAAHGEPFRDIFEKAGRDFYAVDPELFAPAVIEFRILETGSRLRFGGLSAGVLSRSLGMDVGSGDLGVR